MHLYIQNTVNHDDIVKSEGLAVFSEGRPEPKYICYSKIKEANEYFKISPFAFKIANSSNTLIQNKVCAVSMERKRYVFHMYPGLDKNNIWQAADTDTENFYYVDNNFIFIDNEALEKNSFGIFFSFYMPKSLVERTNNNLVNREFRFYKIDNTEAEQLDLHQCMYKLMC